MDNFRKEYGKDILVVDWRVPSLLKWCKDNKAEHPGVVKKVMTAITNSLMGDYRDISTMEVQNGVLVRM